jgi:ABC-type sugar transport system ATPase subunit
MATVNIQNVQKRFGAVNVIKAPALKSSPGSTVTAK